ncbi:hypothetical protein HHK36_017337 [Tetracentron sinense]|uniref:Uncharacterized protein n=1 Tax=Tetracentron sinense TaxID=13715 RepID=A0A834Z2L8_TETSI|nr:hypothetical protein HHK36_017337 [Tetracentron sinense]
MIGVVGEEYLSIGLHAFNVQEISSLEDLSCCFPSVTSSFCTNLSGIGRLNVTYRRMKDALVQLNKSVQRGPASDLIPVKFGERPPTVSKKDVAVTLSISLSESDLREKDVKERRMNEGEAKVAIIHAKRFVQSSLTEDDEKQRRQTKGDRDLYSQWLPRLGKGSHYHFIGPIKLEERGISTIRSISVKVIYI